jgi:hypothetical protein
MILQGLNRPGGLEPVAGMSIILFTSTLSGSTGPEASNLLLVTDLTGQ